MTFVIVDWLCAIALLIGFAISLKIGLKKFHGNIWVLVFGALFLIKFIIGFAYQRDFYLGLYYHKINNSEDAKKYLLKYLENGPSNRILRIALHYDAAYSKANELIQEKHP